MRLAQVFPFSQGDYLRTTDRVGSLAHWDTLVALANPVALAAALVVPGSCSVRSIDLVEIETLRQVHRALSPLDYRAQ